MNNLLSYDGLTDARMNASEKDLPVPRMIESVPKTFMPIQTSVLHCELIELQIGWSQRCF